MPSPDAPRIYYYTPDHDVPSWGIGMLHNHVRLLRRNGFDAYVLHDRRPFRISWYRSRVPRVYLDTPGFRPQRHDVLVIPEVVAARKHLRRFRCRRVVFVQGSSLITLGLAPDAAYESLGFEFAIAVMPHVKAILDRYFSIPNACVPPCIAPYFFSDGACLTSRQRKRRIVLFPKRGSDDYHTLERVLRDRLPQGWRLVEIVDRPHRQVARLFRESAFHVNVNSQESLNATVAEAMAAGCIPICYDAYGGLDYLVPGGNAYVLPNRHIFPLIDRVLELVSRYGSLTRELDAVRGRGVETAQSYREAITEKALLECYRRLLL